MLVNELVMARPRSLTASPSTRARARSAWRAQSCAIAPCWLQVITRCWISRLRSRRPFEKRNAFRAVARAGERNPQVFPAGAVEFFKFGQQRSAGDGPDIATPLAAKQGGAGRGRCSPMCPRRRGTPWARTYCRGRCRRGAGRLSARPGARRSAARCRARWPAAARSRAACAPGRGRFFPAPADPAACAKGFPTALSSGKDTVVYYNPSPLKSNRK